MTAMTRERLESYKSNRSEIKELMRQLRRLTEGEDLLRASVILDYRTGYPHPQSIIGYDYELEKRRRKRYEDQIAKLRAEQDNIEEWVLGVRDGLTRRILQLYFLEGKTQSEVARIVHLHQSCVSRKIDDALKNA